MDSSRIKSIRAGNRAAVTKFFKKLDELNTDSEMDIDIAACQAYLKADIVFALDSSGSVGLSHFKKQIDFVKDFVNKFSIGPTRTQFSVVTFSDTVNNEFTLNEYPNKHRLINAIDNIKYRIGATNTHLALEFVTQNSFLSANGGRSKIKRIVIILTDGKSQIPDQTKKAAEQLHLLGAQVISVGIGSGVDILEITRIASDKQNVVKVENFDKLTTIETQIQNAACQKKSERDFNETKRD
ncbi:matrilin-1-like [Mytilus galloprovincialis]|uniref:matrilin-1-like n=1 Tax=Mytilus galloprovincialis TaxID=29158 RepID=UPI003F7B8214